MLCALFPERLESLFGQLTNQATDTVAAGRELENALDGRGPLGDEDQATFLLLNPGWQAMGEDVPILTGALTFVGPGSCNPLALAAGLLRRPLQHEQDLHRSRD